ncbi:RNA polymerase sigma factor [Vibrio fujianensis]|uniref:RNA polymerase sigma factor n=1 Tax=Vibrio fujianensis TaxID=1974215 RepID=UPI000C16E461|nr:sigma factor-like helix-turn-helix DNA-binding protein [Vibrio fujianensis]
MSIPLRKISRDGKVYRRRSEIEQLIDELEKLSIAEQVERCLDEEELIPMEVLLYFLRVKELPLTPILFKSLFEMFVRRLEGALRRSIVDWSYQKPEQAEDIRQEILGRFVELIAKDRNDDGVKLDYFEVNFNDAFHKFRIDVLRQIGPARKEDPLSNAVPIERESDSEVRTDVEISALELSELSKSILNDPSFRICFQNAISELPEDERRVIGLYLQGLPVESKDADKSTISSILGCSDRTVRNRLKRAYSALKDKLLLEEEL